MIDSKTNRLSSKEIERMIQDSKRFAEDDKEVKKRADAKSELEL